MSARLVITDASVLSLPRHVKLRHDDARERWVMLAPERVLVPDETALEIVRLCDGAASVSDIVETLAKKYDAGKDMIGKDVTAMLQDLADKGFLINAAPAGDGETPGGPHAR